MEPLPVQSIKDLAGIVSGFQLDFYQLGFCEDKVNQVENRLRVRYSRRLTCDAIRDLGARVLKGSCH